MSNLQKEVERILDQSGNLDSFMKGEDFSGIYRLADIVLAVKRINGDITVTVAESHFDFRVFPYYPEWYPVQAIQGQEVIPIVINYENGRAHSTRNWYRFMEVADEAAQMIMDKMPDDWLYDRAPKKNVKDTNEETGKRSVFEQMALWP